MNQISSKRTHAQQRNGNAKTVGTNLINALTTNITQARKKPMAA